MQTHTRARITWALIATTAAYALFNVLLFYATDTFGPGWFVTGLVVYGGLFVAAVLLALTERRPPEPAAVEPEATDVAQAVAPVAQKPRRELVFEEGDDSIVRNVDEEGNSRVVVVTNGAATTIEDIERAVDEAEHEPSPLHTEGPDQVTAAARGEESEALDANVEVRA